RARRAYAEGPGGSVRPVLALPALRDEVLEESEARQGLLEVAAPGRQLRKVVRGQRGLQRRRSQEVGRPPDVGQGRQAPSSIPAGGPPDSRLRASGPGVGRG